MAGVQQTDRGSCSHQLFFFLFSKPLLITISLRHLPHHLLKTNSKVQNMKSLSLLSLFVSHSFFSFFSLSLFCGHISMRKDLHKMHSIDSRLVTEPLQVCVVPMRAPPHPHPSRSLFCFLFSLLHLELITTTKHC